MTDPSEILSERNAEVAKIRNFADLTETAKQERIAAVTERANAEFAEAKEAEKRGREERLATSRKAVFTIVDDASASPSERAQIFAAYRHAAGEVRWAATESEPTGTTEGLLDLLDRAERSGDTIMAKAIFHHAIDHNLQPLVDRYLEDRPEENRLWERYVAALQEDRAAKDVMGGLLNNALTSRALSDGAQ
jgi:hypothetical protein